MLVDGKPYRTIWLEQEAGDVHIIDQRKLPHVFQVERIDSVEMMTKAIKDMHVRGAGLIGASAGAGMHLVGCAL